MRAVLKLELIADDFFWAKRNKKNMPFQQWFRHMKKLGPDKSPSWVARLLPNMEREFVQGTRDYSRANRSGSRGIYAYYALKPGIYEINERCKLNRVRRYFIQVVGDEYQEITREEAECLINDI